MRETIGRVVFDWVARLDARHVVDSLRGDLGVDIQLVCPCPGGQVGAALVSVDRGARRRATYPGLPVYLLESGPGFCLYEPLLQHSAGTRRLLGWVREVGRDCSPTLTGGDAVHEGYAGGSRHGGANFP